MNVLSTSKCWYDLSTCYVIIKLLFVPYYKWMKKFFINSFHLLNRSRFLALFLALITCKDSRLTVNKTVASIAEEISDRKLLEKAAFANVKVK